MAEPRFFTRGAPRPVGEIAAAIGAEVEPAHAHLLINDVAPLEFAGPDELAYFDNPRYLGQFSATRAGACLIAARFADRVPDGVVALVASEPYRAFALAAALFYPDAMRPLAIGLQPAGEISPAAHIAADARLEEGVTVEPGAVIGPNVEIGRNTFIGAHAVIAREVRVGRDCSIGPGCTLQHALIGNRVIIHPGVRVGQDGFGFAMGRTGHLKVPQIGRVIIQDDVEIGANTTIDRGATRDTVVGEGTKIDNQVQLGHNVVIGRHCVLAAQVGIAGSTSVGDFVAMGGQVGIGGHVKIGDGAQLAGASGVMSDIPARARYGGLPARPIRQMFREVATLERLAKRMEAEDREMPRRESDRKEDRGSRE